MDGWMDGWIAASIDGSFGGGSRDDGFGFLPRF